MHTVPMIELFNAMEDNPNAQWIDTRNGTVSRQTPGVCLDAIANLEGDRMYFHIREPGAGYTIYEYETRGHNARPVSVAGQFYSEREADKAVRAFAQGRITSADCRGSYQSRHAESVDSILLYRRNQARGGSIKNWRENQKARLIPKDQAEAATFIVQYVTQHLSKAAADVVRAGLEVPE